MIKVERQFLFKCFFQLEKKIKQVDQDGCGHGKNRRNNPS
jgi:hypothetical protein